jgi:metallophosphoesterase (TIGR00282 family)
VKILLVGDVFGKAGRRALFELLPGLIRSESIDFVIVNGENAAGGKGLTPEICHQFWDAGADVVTTGNHARDKKEIDPLLDESPRLLRPINYPFSVPGRGNTVLKSRSGYDVAVLNLSGRVHMGEIESPFVSIMKSVSEMKQRTPIVILDFHAEATSEKRAMGWYLNGHVSAVIGTHTHVQTADEEVLSGGTAYITDAGMTGSHDSVIGLKTELGLDRFLRGDKSKFEAGKKDVRLCGALVDVDETTGKARSISRVRIDLPDLPSA